MKQTKTDQKLYYERPSMEVVELHHRTMLLAGSPDGMRGRDRYIPDDDNPFGE